MEKSKTGANRSWTTWFEIPVNDMEQAKKFYETVFDIKIDVVDFGGFKMGILPHSDVGGALVEGESYKPSTEGALVYLNANPDLITKIVNFIKRLRKNLKAPIDDHSLVTYIAKLEQYAIRRMR